MSKWQGDGYTAEQRAVLHDLVAKLPPAPCCPDESRLVRDLRGMLDSQDRVSEQHHKRVQELAGEIERLRQRSRDEDTARIRLNHARIEAEDKNARPQALLAERDAEVARLKLTTRSDREYAEMKQRAEEAEGQIARLVRAGEALTAKSPCFITIRPGGNDIECCQFCLTDNGHDPLCEWVGLVAALAARGGEGQG